MKSDALFSAPDLRSKVRVLLVLNIGGMGGAELSMLSVAKGLRAKGYLVTLVLFGHGSAPEEQLAVLGIELIRLPAKRTLAAIVPLYKLMRRIRPSIVISALTHTNIITVLATKMACVHTKVIVTEHGQISLDRKLLRRWEGVLLPRLTGFLYSFADSIVVVSKGLSDFIKGIVPQSLERHIRVIYNPVVPDAFTLSRVVPHPWLTEPHPPVIIGVGRLEKEKNFALLVKAFAKVAAKSDARLIILGEGSQLFELGALAQSLGIGDRVLMPGFVQDVFEWLHAANVFVCASFYEGFCNALVEAMASGLTVVSTNCPYGPAEILDSGRYGHLVPINDPDSMAASILQALETPLEKSVIVTRATEFNETRCYEAYDQLIMSLHQAA